MYESGEQCPTGRTKRSVWSFLSDISSGITYKVARRCGVVDCRGGRKNGGTTHRLRHDEQRRIDSHPDSSALTVSADESGCGSILTCVTARSGQEYY